MQPSQRPFTALAESLAEQAMADRDTLLAPAELTVELTALLVLVRRAQAWYYCHGERNALTSALDGIPRQTPAGIRPFDRALATALAEDWAEPGTPDLLYAEACQVLGVAPRKGDELAAVMTALYLSLAGPTIDTGEASPDGQWMEVDLHELYALVRELLKLGTADLPHWVTANVVELLRRTRLSLGFSTLVGSS